MPVTAEARPRATVPLGRLRGGGVHVLQVLSSVGDGSRAVCATSCRSSRGAGLTLWIRGPSVPCPDVRVGPTGHDIMVSALRGFGGS